VNYRQVLDQLRPDGADWIAEVSEDWLQGRTIFGGMQVALAVRAMRALMPSDAPRLPLRSLQATFVGPIPAGAGIRLGASLLRSGKSVTHARCDLVHEGTVACTVVAIFGAARRSSFALEIPRPVVSAEADALPDPPYVEGISPAFTKHIQLRWAEGQSPYTGYHEPRATMYARLRDASCTPEDALVALGDAIPPPALSTLREPAPASSLNWTLELLGDADLFDPRQWALIGAEVRAGADGYLSQTAILWGAAGHAFAVSHQTVAMFG
jgi:acyl-CoA thioesterase